MIFTADCPRAVVQHIVPLAKTEGRVEETHVEG